MNWLRRLQRLCRQSTIRLPRRDLTASDLQPGDRLQIAARWWRLTAWESPEPASGAFELESDDANQRTAKLRFDDEARWWLVDEGQVIELDTRTVVHFPVAEHGL